MVCLLIHPLPSGKGISIVPEGEFQQRVAWGSGSGINRTRSFGDFSFYSVRLWLRFQFFKNNRAQSNDVAKQSKI